jgi:chromosome partitioning protein
MRRIAVINQKGGVGKTTTTTNLGAALAGAGFRVLLIDLDPQAHLSLHLGIDPREQQPGTYELLTGGSTLAQARKQVANNLWLVGSSIDLAAAEVELVSVVGREVILRDAIEQHVEAETNGEGAPYDFVLMDCPPSLSVLTLNGLCAACEVLIPLQPHYLALQGLGKLLETVSLVSKRINPGLVVTGVVVCMQEFGTKLAGEVIEDVRSFLESSRGGRLPWSSAEIFRTFIRRNSKLAVAPSHGRSIFDYAPDSNGARDYARLARELTGRLDAQEPIQEPTAELAEEPESELEPQIGEAAATGDATAVEAIAVHEPQHAAQPPGTPNADDHSETLKVVEILEPHETIEASDLPDALQSPAPEAPCYEAEMQSAPSPESCGITMETRGADESVLETAVLAEPVAPVFASHWTLCDIRRLAAAVARASVGRLLEPAGHPAEIDPAEPTRSTSPPYPPMTPYIHIDTNPGRTFTGIAV